MSCFVAPIQGGNPLREIFPLTLDRMAALQSVGLSEMLTMLPAKSLDKLQVPATQHVGAVLRTDGAPFYLTTVAPEFPNLANPVGHWWGAFFAPFGVADVVGTVEGVLAAPGALPTSLRVRARLLPDPGQNPVVYTAGRKPMADVEWEVRGNQATRPNKAALIGSVTVHDAGPHRAEDIRRCVALHAPQRAFGEARAIVAMQCGVAAACLLEAIC